MKFEKGKELEIAYKRIQKQIVADHPDLNSTGFLFESNVKKTIEGVLYEVDLKIIVNRNTEFESIFIVECKNWDRKKIDPKEISYFIEKINAFGATKGYFAGTKFSRFAINRAQQEKRLELLRIDKEILSPVAYGAMVFEIPENRKYDVCFLTKDEDINNQTDHGSIDYFPNISINGETKTADLFVTEKVNLYVETILKNLNKIPFKEGLNILQTKILVENKDSILETDLPFEFTRILIDVKLEFIRFKKVHISKYNIENKGVYYSECYNVPCTEPLIELASIITNKETIEEMKKAKIEDLKVVESVQRIDVDNKFIEVINSQLKVAKEKGELAPYIHEISL